MRKGNRARRPPGRKGPARQGSGTGTGRDPQPHARPRPQRGHGSNRVGATDQQARGARSDAGQHERPHGRAGGANKPHARQASEPPTTLTTSIPPGELERALSAHGCDTLVRGEWLWTTREGAERDLIEELLYARPNAALRPRRLSGALVASRSAPDERDGRLDLTFARQGFRIMGVARAASIAELAAALTPALTECIAGEPRYALHVFVPDSTAANALATRAQALRDTLPVAEGVELLDDAQLRRHGGKIIQVCLCDGETAVLGCTNADSSLSLWPGGRARMRLGGDFPSRAARKLAEAFAWLGLSPGGGELCVDLGAAPGGWSWLLLEKKARVIAVDPARMDAALMKNPRLRHVPGNAFDYEPEEPVDWLFCDMAYRPLEVAQMLGRWARRRHTRLLIANFKLPMKRKVEMVARLRGLLAQQGFVGIRTRQLYHDRDEITLAAHVR